MRAKDPTRVRDGGFTFYCTGCGSTCKVDSTVPILAWTEAAKAFCENHRECATGVTSILADAMNAGYAAAAPGLIEALKEISKAEGRYSRDPLEHASNTIEDIQALAVKAIAKVEGR